MKCESCGSENLYAEIPVYTGLNWNATLKRWELEGSHESGDRATIYCNDCNDSWEEYISEYFEPIPGDGELIPVPDTQDEAA